MSSSLIQLFCLIICTCYMRLSWSRTVVVNGGQVSVFGAVTQTQIDLKIDYTSNVKWILMIWGPDEVNTDAHLFQIDPNNAASPVLIQDCYLNQNSHITIDDVNNIQPSVTSFKGSIKNGIKAAYNRDLNTGDSADIRLYVNSVVQVCFISSNSVFKGNGTEKGQEKACSFLSLHIGSDSYDMDRLLGNFAGTTLFGGANLTFYATKSTQGATAQPWLFLSVVHKQQGLSPFNPRWIGVTYTDSLNHIDLTMISYEMLNYKVQVGTRDMYAETAIFAQEDKLFTVKQGGNDVVKVYGAYDQIGYLVASFKRKFSTGDVNRDTIVQLGESRYCFIYGNTLPFERFVQPQRQCIDFTLKSNYLSNFRVASKNGPTQLTVIEYKKPNNTVSTKKNFEEWLPTFSAFSLLLVSFLIAN